MEKNYYNKKPQTSPQREVPLIVTEVTPSESLRIFIFSCSNFRICFLAVAYGGGTPQTGDGSLLQRFGVPSLSPRLPLLFAGGGGNGTVWVTGSDLRASITKPCFMADPKRSRTLGNHNTPSCMPLVLIHSRIYLSYTVTGLCKM